MAGVMIAGLISAVAAFTVLYLYLLALRLRVGRLEDRAVAEALSPRHGQPVEELLDDPEPEPAHG
jgi:hypothetical protein